MFPVIGAYVVLAIDPERTLEALDDPEVALVTKNIKPRLYVGYVSRVGRIFQFPWSMPLTDENQFRVSPKAFWIISRLSSHSVSTFFARASHRRRQKNA
jgi:hypothetical protein